MTLCPNFESLSAYVDDEHGDLDPKAARHIETCPACQRRVAEIEAINLALRSEARSIVAPERLAASIERRSLFERVKQAGARTMSRRAAFIGGGALVGGAAAASLLMLRTDHDGRLAPTLFRDYVTRVAADLTLDIESTDVQTVKMWFDARLSFAAPDIPALDETDVRGGRLCWLLGRRFAVIHIGAEPAAHCLYIAEAAQLTLTEHRALPTAEQAPALLGDHGAVGAFWTNGLAFALIGRARREVITDLATRLRRV